ncbi:MAG: substrate-binding domain-containing protein [Ilumatobacteraceae bacterium]|nr:substrate-binding domain-containing protein [Ilumatobacteraceae bacterium]MBJ7293457.1 substrate-binding domain-containing protein [Ilumatobacteraceae bacterium]MBJ7490388.1 substrate-binding domain-containing protein [Ilumatobacteraceae bacterium]
MKLSKKIAVAVAASALIGSAGLVNPAQAATADNIVAGGATFPQNIIESCRATFPGDSTANPNAATVNYTGVGSGTGRTNFFGNTYDFGMSDSLWKSSDTNYRTSFVFLPLISGAINVAYRLDGVKPAGTVLQLTPTTVAKIFAGTIKTWNDASIKLDNPVAAKPKLSGLNGAANFSLAKKGTKAALTVSLKPSIVNSKTKNMVVTSSKDGGVTNTPRFNAKPKAGKVVLSLPYSVGTEYTIKYNNAVLGTVSIDATSVILPATPITVYHRKETSGTTNNFLNFLNKTVPAVWTTSAADAFGVPSGTLPTDGSFVGAQGNDGVANGIMNKDGGIGYAEVSFVNERQTVGKLITSAKVMNPAGVFLAGTSAGAAKFVEAAAVNSTTGVVTFDYATKVADAYPITAVSYAMANTSANTNSANTAAKMLTAQRFVNYILDTCAPNVAELKGYAALPASIVTISKTLSANIK